MAGILWKGLLVRKGMLLFPLKHIAKRASSDFAYISRDNAILPVLIVGAGPVGLVLSILLTKLGIKCAVLEKRKTFSKHPQAHFINNRSMEVFRKLDGLADEIGKLQPPVDFWRKFIYCTSLTGTVLGSVDHIRPQDLDHSASPVSVAHFSQYKLTNLLFKQLEKLGFQLRSCERSESLIYGPLRGGEILMGHECISINATDNHVSVTASYFDGNNLIRNDIQCQLLVGADGAGSIVRKLEGIGMTGEKDLQKLVSVHFLSQDLGKFLMDERPGMLFFIFNTEAIGVLVAHDLKQGEFVLQMPFYPPQQKLEDFSSEICEVLICKLVGRELADVVVIDIKPWVMHAEVANKFLSHNKRIILVGDAAHRFPPAGGFGMNTGIQDAHNLAWKIACFIHGTAPISILSTYEMERWPIASFNTALSVENFKAAMAVPAALGLDPTIANRVHRVLKDTVGSVLPHGLQRTILDGLFAIGRAQLSESFLNERNLLGSSRLAKLKQIFKEGKSLQLQFPMEDLGFRYLEGAVVPDDDSFMDPPKAPSGRRKDYIPSSNPGCRLPHMDIRLMSRSKTEGKISTLDLVSSQKVEFVLIIAPLEDSYHLARVAFEVAMEFKISLKVCVMWRDGNINEGGKSKTKLRPWENFLDIMEVKRSPTLSSSWWDLCQMTEKGAILVRPDEHIAWRVKSRMVDPISEMRRVFSAVLKIESVKI